jgi:hypothetical protein
MTGNERLPGRFRAAVPRQRGVRVPTRPTGRGRNAALVQLVCDGPEARYAGSLQRGDDGGGARGGLPDPAGRRLPGTLWATSRRGEWSAAKQTGIS